MESELSQYTTGVSLHWCKLEPNTELNFFVMSVLHSEVRDLCSCAPPS